MFFRYSIYFFFCFFCVIVLLTVRPLVCIYFGRNGWSCLETVYAGLYFIPITVATHALLGGVICKYGLNETCIFFFMFRTCFIFFILDFTFPYIVIVASMTSIGIHFATKPVQVYNYVFSFNVNCPHTCFQCKQSVKYLIEDTVYEPRNLIIVGLHWICHGYGIVAVTQFLYPPLAYNLWLLVPLPTIFYITTVNLSAPRKIGEL